MGKPQVGRFITRDVVADKNLYQYSGDNPVMYVDPSGYVQEVIGVYAAESIYPFSNTDSNSSLTSPLGTYNNENRADRNNTDGGVTNGPVVKLATKVFSEALNKVTANAIEEVALKGTKTIAKDYVKRIPFAGYAVGTVLDANKYGWGGAAKKNLIDTGAELAVTGVIATVLIIGGMAIAPALGATGIGVFLVSTFLDVGLDLRVSRLFGF